MSEKFVRIYAIIAIGLAAILLVTYLSYTGPSTTQESSQGSQTSEQKEQTSKSSQSSSIPAQSLSYGDTVNAYADRRIQFDENCVVSPSYPTFKKGTKIMLDNRSSKQRSIYLDGQAYNFQPYSFKVITLTTTYPLPHTITVDCGTGKNNGRILLKQ